jgi:hypothetical protein
MGDGGVALQSDTKVETANVMEHFISGGVGIDN